MPPKPKIIQTSSVIAHEGEVLSMSIGPKTGTVYATGGEDRIINLWTIGSKSPRIYFGPFQSGIVKCQFNPYEDKILTGNMGGTVMLFDLNAQRAEMTWTAHRSAVHDLCFHTQNSNLVLTCGYDGKMNVLSRQQRHPAQCFTLHRGPANSVDISTDGRYAATGGDDKTVRIYDLVASRELCKFECHTDAVTCVKFHPIEPVLASCGRDRTVRFYDLTMNKEVPTSFPLDSESVELCRFAPEDPALLSLSIEYLKVSGWDPPTSYASIIAGIEVPKDMVVVDDQVLIGSARGDRAFLHKMSTNGLQPFEQHHKPVRHSNVSRQANLDQPESGRRTPRLIDMSEMPKRNTKSRAASIEDDIPEKPKSSGRERLLRPGSVGAHTPTSSRPSTSSTGSQQYSEFRKERSSFMNEMNDRYSRLTRINEALDTMTFVEVLQQAAESGKFGIDLLNLVAVSPESITLEHAAPIMQICALEMRNAPDISVSTAESMLQSFGRLVYATQQTPGSGVDVALEERKERAHAFVNAFKQIAPALRQIAKENSSNGETAKGILDEWKVLLK